MSLPRALQATPHLAGLNMSLVGIGALFALTATFLVAFPGQSAAATSNTINFQARLETASGAIAPDGNYNVEFKLYNAATSSGSSQGSCTGDANCLWTETRTSGNQVRVVNGYLTVNLGSVNAFPTTINWNQELWLTMRIGGTGSPSWDAEMSPRLQLTATPYAFQAGALGNGANSAVFDSSANLQFNQASTIRELSAGTGTALTIQGGAATSGTNTGGTLLLQGGAGASTGASGSVIVKSNTNNSTTAFQVQNASGTAVLTVDTSNNAVLAGTTSRVSDETLTVQAPSGGHWGIITTNGTVSAGFWLGSSTSAQIGTYSNHRLDFITNNGTPQMTLLTNGNFGIGTSSPATLLDVNGTANIVGQLSASPINTIPGNLNLVPNGSFEVNNDATTAFPDQWFGNSAGENIGTASVSSATSTNGANALKLSSGGTLSNIAAGSACFPISPSQTYTFAVDAKASAATSGLVWRIWYFTNATCSTAASTDHADITGTLSNALTTSWQTLRASQTTPSNATYAYIKFHNYQTTNTDMYLDSLVMAPPISSGVNIMGNVGIGTTNPQNALDVAGGVVIGASYAGTNTAPTNGLQVQGNLQVGSSTTDATAVLMIVDSYNQSSDPPCTTGAVYYNSNKAQFRACRNGTWYNLIAGVDVQHFTGNGTWTAPSGISVVMVVACGGGGGGGGGGVGASGSNRSGGGGGGGGAYVQKMLYASDITSSVTVTIGAATSNALSASAGSDGNPTAFGSYVKAAGGGGGGQGRGNGTVAGGGGGGGAGATGTSGGTTSNVAGGDALSAVASGGQGWAGGYGALGTGGADGGPAEMGGGGGGGSDASTGVTSGNGGTSLYGGGGGGGGGDMASGDTPQAAGTGGNSGSGAGYGNGGGGASGAANVAGTAGSSGNSNHCGTGGGGGGASTLGSAGKNGGNGGTPGGGGGGGGASSTSGGTGGAGARGEMWVLSW